jgi:hypothetical protein
MTMPPPDKLDTEVPDKQCSVEFQLFTLLLRFGSGWFANHALQRWREGRGGNRCVPRAGSLSTSLGRFTR